MEAFQRRSIRMPRAVACADVSENQSSSALPFSIEQTAEDTELRVLLRQLRRAAMREPKMETICMDQQPLMQNSHSHTCTGEDSGRAGEMGMLNRKEASTSQEAIEAVTAVGVSAVHVRRRSVSWASKLKVEKDISIHEDEDDVPGPGGNDQSPRHAAAFAHEEAVGQHDIAEYQEDSCDVIERESDGESCSVGNYDEEMTQMLHRFQKQPVAVYSAARSEPSL
eukprot:3244042-Rhodomonas_salina.1